MATPSEEEGLRLFAQDLCIGHFLSAAGLRRYAPIFERDEYDMLALRLSTKDDLREMGLPVGPRVLIQRSCRKLGDPLADADGEKYTCFLCAVSTAGSPPISPLRPPNAPERQRREPAPSYPHMQFFFNPWQTGIGQPPALANDLPAAQALQPQPVAQPAPPPLSSSRAEYEGQRELMKQKLQDAQQEREEREAEQERDREERVAARLRALDEQKMQDREDEAQRVREQQQEEEDIAWRAAAAAAQAQAAAADADLAAAAAAVAAAEAALSFGDDSLGSSEDEDFEEVPKRSGWLAMASARASKPVKTLPSPVKPVGPKSPVQVPWWTLVIDIPLPFLVFSMPFGAF